MTDGAPDWTRAKNGKPDGLTPSQTVGPFFHYMLTPHAYDVRPVFSNDLAAGGADGERIRIEGYVLDGDGEPIVDALVEIWQADGRGRYAGTSGSASANSAFTGFGRVDLDSNGFYSFDTVKPGPTPGPNGAQQAPHANVGVLARGVLRRLFTRIYFADEAANEGDPILALVPAERRQTLIATRQMRGDLPVYTANIRLQGEGETVFFVG